MSPIALRLYFVRHGETQWNRKAIIQGQKDIELNELGLQQARLVGESLKDVRFSLAFSSDLKRAYNTAEVIVEHNTSDVEIAKVVELRERGMGDLEGKEWSKEMGRVEDDTVEPAASFSKRLSKWWRETIVQSVLSKTEEGEEAEVLVVTHGGVIRTLIGNLLGSQKIEAATGVVVWACMNTSVSIVELGCGGRSGVLTRYGDVRHLVGGARSGTNADEAAANGAMPTTETTALLGGQNGSSRNSGALAFFAADGQPSWLASFKWFFFSSYFNILLWYT